MKPIAWSALVFVLLSLPFSGISQQAPRAQFAASLAIQGVGVYKIDFTADSIQRQDRVISFRGNVDIRITSIAGRVSRVFQADEVIYNLDTPGDVELPRLGHFTFGK